MIRLITGEISGGTNDLLFHIYLRKKDKEIRIQTNELEELIKFSKKGKHPEGSLKYVIELGKGFENKFFIQGKNKDSMYELAKILLKFLKVDEKNLLYSVNGTYFKKPEFFSNKV